ncbi:hypothetical protein RRG08_043844 [Elysia crispata]|uniref:Uncharacterized protein n=1 Tax=Elysia crispata TaxID=231223 RepID=A0AAE0XVE2_9GAST|nr:hypothetical protein RRG08_043844 [Elysia crispata]
MYTFCKADRQYQSVCQLFFLNKLGLKVSSDKIIRKSYETAVIDNQRTVTNAADLKGKHGSRNPVHKIVHEGMGQYHPLVPHSRREHAPLRRYLPSDLSLPEVY